MTALGILLAIAWELRGRFPRSALRLAGEAPEFLEQAARELLERERKERSTAKLPETAAPLGSGTRLG